MHSMYCDFFKAHEREREGERYMLILVMGDGTRLPVAWKTGSGNK